MAEVLAILLTSLVLIGASVLLGAAILRLLGREESTPLAGAVGFAALTVACAILIQIVEIVPVTLTAVALAPGMARREHDTIRAAFA